MMLGISRLMRERTKLPAGDPDRMSPSTIPQYFAPVKKLFDMNGVTIAWKRVYMTFPEKKVQSDARGWTREEISRLLTVAESAKCSAVILLPASSGMRKCRLGLLWALSKNLQFGGVIASMRELSPFWYKLLMGNKGNRTKTSRRCR